jgi:putative transposase
MNLFPGMLIQWQNTPQPVVERILWIDPSGSAVICCNVFGQQLQTTMQTCVSLEDALQQGEAIKLEHDPFKLPPKRPAKTPKALEIQQKRQKEDEEHRDAAWERIRPIVEDEQVYDFRARSRLIGQRAKQLGCRTKLLRRDILRYWQGGQIKDALKPQYQRCGGRGKVHKVNQAKRGRQSTKTKVDLVPTGINVTPKVAEYFHRGIELFYLKRKKPTIQQAFDKTLKRFFNRGYEWKNGVRVAVLPPEDELPTLRQFKYWYYKNVDIVKNTIAREGERAYLLRSRPVLGDSTAEARGPGALYQIDATVGDIYLVSAFDRSRLIGRPVIYIIIDVFSRLIVGMAVTLEGPSWAGAMLALENMTLDKVAFCREYGIPINPEEWPSCHLPFAIRGDRGEMLSKNSDILTDSLGIRVSQTPAYRPDWKAIVERSFRLLNDMVIKWVPGARYERERGEPDCRLDACLTLDEFRQLLIECIIEYNTSHRLEGYPLSELMLADHVRPYPSLLWEWGMQNITGELHTRTREEIQQSLLPKYKAVVTESGIRLGKLFYTCKTGDQEQWWTKARREGHWPITALVDPRTTNAFFISFDDGRPAEVAMLLPRSQGYAGRDWQDLEYHHMRDIIDAMEARTGDRMIQLEREARREQIFKEAQKATKSARAGQSDHAFLQDSRANRSEDKDRLRIQENWIAPQVPTPIHALTQAQEDPFLSEEYADLRRMRES